MESKNGNIPQVSKKNSSKGKKIILLVVILLLILCALTIVFAWLGGYAKSIICKTVLPDSIIYNKVQCSSSANVSNTQDQFPITTLNSSNSNNQNATSQQEAVEAIIQNLGGSVVGIGVIGDNGNQDQIIGTGFLVSQSGLLVTNRHVIENTQYNYYVIFKDSAGSIPITASNIISDPVNDIALIKIDPSKIPSTAVVIPLGDSDKLKVGESVVAIGNPLGTYTGSATQGIISGLHRQVNVSQGFFSSGSSSYSDVIQTDAAINPGNSGGPLLNLNGEAIGVDFATIDGASNLSFALPINRVKARIAEFNQYGKFRIPYLGVQYQTRVAFISNQSMVGAQVLSVVSQSPADKAGMKVGDIIVNFNGKDLTDNALTDLIQATTIGSKVDVVILRNNQQQTISVTIGER